jgi:DNA repair protein RecN (Recombination protein N)
VAIATPLNYFIFCYLMLLSLRISNFALIDELTIDFDRGLNVLTGETGAGKSIILDAIDALLGGSVQSRMVRTGAQQSLLEGVFCPPAQLAEWLQANHIGVQADLVCSREIRVNGKNLRSRLRVNGTLVNKQTMTNLREQLVEITAQGQTGQLLAGQRQLLDGYGGVKLQRQRQQVATLFATWQQTQQQLIDRQQQAHTRSEKVSLLQFHLQELDLANLATADELETLEQEHRTLNHVVDLQQQSYQVYQLLYQNDSGEISAAADLLGKAENVLTGMVDIDPQLQTILEAVSNGLSQIIYAGREVNSYGDNLEADPARLEEIEERLRFLKQLCRRYNNDLAGLMDYYQQIQAELADLMGMAESIEALTQLVEQQYAALVVGCDRLTKLRQRAAETLEQQLISELQPLGMLKVKFAVDFQPQSPSPQGADVVTFMFSPNPGEAMQPLIATASGGEMSRFLLALKTCFSAITGTSTLIFDEIDTGVSGKVTQLIADKLQLLTEHHQILCVTHQPIMAAMADAHFHVHKEGQGKKKAERTIIKIERLELGRRREEIAQLAGGHTAAESIAFADALLSKVNGRKVVKDKLPLATKVVKP